MAGEIERIVPGNVLWDRLYSEHAQRYEFARMSMPVRARVLDAGCGAGYGAALLADAGAERVIAVDISPSALDTARERFSRENIEWVMDDCHTLDRVSKHAPFDLICNLENLEHLAQPDRFLSRAGELLAPDGVLVTSTPNRVGVNRLRGMRPDAPSTNPFHVHEYTAEEFAAMLRPHFEEIRLAFQTMEPPGRMDLEAVARALWQNPFVRLGCWLQRVGRGHPVAERLDDLLPAARWRIILEDPGDALTGTQLAICRGPRMEAARARNDG